MKILEPDHPIWIAVIGLIGLVMLSLFLVFGYSQIDIFKDGRTAIGSTLAFLIPMVFKWYLTNLKIVKIQSQNVNAKMEKVIEEEKEHNIALDKQEI